MGRVRLSSEDYGSAYPKIIGGHFAVATRNQALLYLDLLNPSQGLQEFPLPKLTNNNSSFIDVLGAEYGGEGEKFLVVEYPANTKSIYGLA